MTVEPKSRRTVLLLGGGLALAAGLGVALLLASRSPSPAQKEGEGLPGTGLQVEVGRTDSIVEAARPLRCFVEGRYVGEMSLNDCARRNGVATGALDVGLDPSGAVAAGEGQQLQPLPQPLEQAPPQSPAGGNDNMVAATPAETAATPAAAPGAACWRFNGVSWRQISSDSSLNDCVQALFAGQCVRPGSASYGRWSNQTLRLVTGRVERSGDNRSFRTLASQPPGECVVPPVGE
ncbi:MAG TPA: hypothetical protein VF559_08175 [Caulobacteraceae bacterium]|jgi:hypothetical protein